MNEYLLNIIKAGHLGSIYATRSVDDRSVLVRLGDYDTLRHQYNQMACLIGALAMRTILAQHTKPMHSTAALPGSWVDRFGTGKAIGGPGVLLDAACQPPSDFSDSVGLRAWYADWPQGSTNLLSGMQNMGKSMADIGDVFYAFNRKSTVAVGGSMERSTVKRVKEALKEAKRDGRTIFEEDQLLQFLEVLLNARNLHFFHEVDGR